MKTQLIMLALVVCCITGYSRTFVPLRFLAPGKTSVQFIYDGDITLAWTFLQRNSSRYSNLDMKNMEFTLVLANMFQEPIQTYVLRDTALVIKRGTMPAIYKGILVTLVAKAKNRDTGEITSFEAMPISLRNITDQISIDTTATQTAAASQNRVKTFLSANFFLNALNHYYSHPEYRTKEEDEFFEKYLACIATDRPYKIKFTDVTYFIEALGSSH